MPAPPPPTGHPDPPPWGVQGGEEVPGDLQHDGALRAARGAHGGHGGASDPHCTLIQTKNMELSTTKIF